MTKLIIFGITAILASVFTPAVPVFALDTKQVDTMLASKLDKISTLANDADSDKLISANEELMKYLKGVAVNKQINSDPLKTASDKGLTVFTSDDKKVRCYSWDSLTGGTMHFFKSLITFDTGKPQLHYLPTPTNEEGDGDPGATFEGLDTIKTAGGRTVYLIRDLFIGSGLDHGRTIQAFVISNGKLSEHPFFQAKKKMLSTISFAFGEYGDTTEFVLSPDKKTLKVPLIKPAPKNAPGSGSATGKYLTYTFDGTKFVFKR